MTSHGRFIKLSGVFVYVGQEEKTIIVLTYNRGKQFLRLCAGKYSFSQNNDMQDC